MTHDWILDVLADLERFAELNDLTDLSERLAGTRAVAATEIERLAKEKPRGNSPSAPTAI